ncbi:glycosyltransferase family 4 protein [Intrasporangium calvum]|uniref:glycosyltransferase family 4 protein n=1 Tax=Intrasporangium calvum TaxID=53358 RepID=UPI0011D2131A|nr:glycosyltransferase family 4 protein [Intrasporangium calvum]
MLYVIDSLAPGGAETSLAEMAPEMVSRGVELHIVPLGDRTDLLPELEQAGANVHTQQPPGGRVVNIRRVMHVARRIQPDLVHTTLFEADFAGRIAARALNIPSSSSIVNDSYGPSHYAESTTAKLHAARALDAATARFSTRFHAISAAIAESVPPRLGIPSSRVEVIPRGRDPEKFPFQQEPVRSLTRQRLGIGLGTPVVLVLSRLEPQKGLLVLIRALRTVVRMHPDVVVLFAGREGRAGAALRSESASLMADVRFLGHRTDAAALLTAADVLCFPSEREGFGGVLIEAMAVGCPVVASSIPTTLEVLGEDIGTITPVGDTRGLADALNRVLSDKPAAAASARRGRARFDELFTTDAVVNQMIDFFERSRSR